MKNINEKWIFLKVEKKELNLSEQFAEKWGGMLEKYKFSSKKKILKSRNKIKGNIGKGKILNEKWIWNGKKKTETQSKERTCV